MQGDPLQELAAAIQAHPNYEMAVLSYVDRKLDHRSKAGFLNEAISSLRATHVLTYTLLLHYESEGRDASQGATFGNVLALCEKRDLAGSRSVRTMLTVCQLAGLLHRVRSVADHRVYTYEPTEKLIEGAREVVSRSIEPFDVLVPGRNFGHLPNSDPRFIKHFLTTALRRYVDLKLSVAEYHPALHDILLQKGGTSALAAIVQAELRGQRMPSTHQLGEMYRFSASQGRNIVERAGRHGLVTLSEHGQLVEARELTHLYKSYFARELALYGKYALALEPQSVSAS